MSVNQEESERKHERTERHEPSRRKASPPRMSDEEIARLASKLRDTEKTEYISNFVGMMFLIVPVLIMFAFSVFYLPRLSAIVTYAKSITFIYHGDNTLNVGTTIARLMMLLVPLGLAKLLIRSCNRFDRTAHMSDSRKA